MTCYIDLYDEVGPNNKMKSSVNIQELQQQGFKWENVYVKYTFEYSKVKG